MVRLDTGDKAVLVQMVDTLDILPNTLPYSDLASDQQ